MRRIEYSVSDVNRDVEGDRSRVSVLEKSVQRLIKSDEGLAVLEDAVQTILKD